MKIRQQAVMTAFDPSYFFDLSQFEHSEIFNSNEPVWRALENIERHLSTQLLGKIKVDIPAGTSLIDPHLISIGEGTVIEPGAYIKGPCVIGRNCIIRHGAYIRGNVIAGNMCVIGHDTEIKHSILLDGAHAAHFAYVGNSIIGNRVNLGAGVKCANLKLDNSFVTVFFNGRHIETGLRKLGAIVGDDSQIGCNTVTNPGALFGKHVLCYPVLNVGGYIASHSMIKSKPQHFIISSSHSRSLA